MGGSDPRDLRAADLQEEPTKRIMADSSSSPQRMSPHEYSAVTGLGA